MGNVPVKTGFSTALQIQETLWTKARRVVRQQEVDELQQVVGKELIDENEALFDELEGLADILESYREETDAMVRERNEVRRSLVGKQKLRLEATLREMLEKAKDLQSLSDDSSRLANHLLETRPRRAASEAYAIPSATPSSFPASTPETTLSSTITSLGGVARDLTEIVSSLSLRSAEEIDRLEMLSEDLRDMLRDEQRALLDDIDWVRGLIEEEIRSRTRVKTYSEPDMSTLMNLKEELEGSNARREWSERLRRLPSTRKRLPPQLRGTGGCRGVFTAITYRDQEYSPTPTPSPPGDASPRWRRGQNKKVVEESEPLDPLEDARDWLAVTQTLCESGDQHAALQLLEQQPRPRHNNTPADRFDLGLGLDLDSD